MCKGPYGFVACYAKYRECRLPPSEFTGLCIGVEVSCQVLVTLLCLFWILQSTGHRGKSDVG